MPVRWYSDDEGWHGGLSPEDPRYSGDEGWRGGLSPEDKSNALTPSARVGVAARRPRITNYAALELFGRM